jgi:hypothetical protein
MMVGGSVDWMMTTCLVGWMIRVGSMSGGWIVGGRKGVAVEAGAHAWRKKRSKIAMKQIR